MHSSMGAARRLAAAALLLGVAVLAPVAAEARTNHALIVAVTKYPNVKGADLIGPNNDAALLREYLTTSAPVPFAPENVAVLADGVEGAIASPTHQAIKDELARLTGRVERGDFVFLQLSGHGTQQPAVDPSSEPDGMDEVFLPSDIRQWTDPKKGIPSALADNEIGTALDALREKGAFVWIVIDACHSGTATRAAGLGEQDVRERKLDPQLLDIPESAFGEAAAAASGQPEEGDRALLLYAEEKAGQLGDATPTGADAIVPGGMVAFFAAQTVETTPEMLLPRGAPDAKKYGLFTYTILSQLAANPNMSYRQLGQSVMQAYAAGNRSRPTPLFEGALDAPVFGTAGGDRVQQWKIRVQPTGISLPAGKLHRLTPGTRLAVLPSPSASPEEAMGYVEVRAADNLTARISPVAFDGKAALAPSAIPPNAYARLTEVVFDTELAVARPPANPRYATEIAEVNRLLDAIATASETPVRLRVVDATQPADLKLAVLSEEDVAILVADAGPGATSAKVDAISDRAAISAAPRLWFLPPTAEVSLDQGRRPPSIGFAGSTPEGLTSEVADSLVRIFRATNLARLAGASTFDPKEFEVSFRVVRTDAAEPETLDAGKTPRVHPGDEVHLAAHNLAGGPVDINVLYIGSDYSISHMYAERLHGGSRVELPLLAFNDSSFGVERMVVVLTEGSAITAVEDLGFLAQEGVRQNTRSATHPEGFAGLLRDIGNAPATRGAMKLGQGASARGALLIYQLENMPRS